MKTKKNNKLKSYSIGLGIGLNMFFQEFKTMIVPSDHNKGKYSTHYHK